MKTCPKCNTTGIPNDANFCPSCGQQLKSGWFELVHHKDGRESISLTNNTETYFEISLGFTYIGEVSSGKTLQIPKVEQEIIIAKLDGWKTAYKKIESNTPCRLMIVKDNNRFVIVEDYKQS